jgi:SulP family sulfate permease
MLHQEARRLLRQDRSLTLRRGGGHMVEELRKLEGAEKCPIRFED